MMSRGSSGWLGLERPRSCGQWQEITAVRLRCCSVGTSRQAEQSASVAPRHTSNTNIHLTINLITGPSSIISSAANRLIGEVVQSRRRTLLGPSPGWKRLLLLSHLRHLLCLLCDCTTSPINRFAALVQCPDTGGARTGYKLWWGF